MGETTIPTLDLRMMDLSDPAARGLLTLLDGSRDRMALEAEWRVLRGEVDLPLDAAMARMTGSALMVG